MYITRTNSTNTLLKELIADNRWQTAERYIRAGYQTAGRGQAGNRWESEADKNLLCSILLPPRKNLFELNVIASVAVHRVVNRSVLCQRSGLSSVSEAVSIKWPNDIYWGDRKIAGILIENMIIGSELKYSIAGIGLNVNQTTFVSDAPNPISLKQITDIDYDLEELMNQLLNELDKALTAPQEEFYKAHLYRREGFWPFVEREVSTAPTMNADAQTQGQFMARIKDVLSDGEIVLEDQEGKERKYHFKQIRYVI